MQPASLPFEVTAEELEALLADRYPPAHGTGDELSRTQRERSVAKWILAGRQANVEG